MTAGFSGATEGSAGAHRVLAAVRASPQRVPFVLAPHLSTAHSLDNEPAHASTLQSTGHPRTLDSASNLHPRAWRLTFPGERTRATASPGAALFETARSLNSPHNSDTGYSGATVGSAGAHRLLYAAGRPLRFPHGCNYLQPFFAQVIFSCEFTQ
jgi:hypothetical protein